MKLLHCAISYHSVSLTPAIRAIKGSAVQINDCCQNINNTKHANIYTTSNTEQYKQWTSPRCCSSYSTLTCTPKPVTKTKFKSNSCNMILSYLFIKKQVSAIQRALFPEMGFGWNDWTSGHFLVGFCASICWNRVRPVKWLLVLFVLVCPPVPLSACAFGAPACFWCCERARQAALIAFRSRCFAPLLFLLDHYSSAREVLLRTKTPWLDRIELSEQSRFFVMIPAFPNFWCLPQTSNIWHLRFEFHKERRMH